MTLYTAGAKNDTTQCSRAIASLRERKLLCDTEMQEQVRFMIESLDKLPDGLGASERVNSEFREAKAVWEKLDASKKRDVQTACQKIFDRIQQSVFLVDKFRDKEEWFDENRQDVEKTRTWLDGSGDEKKTKKSTRANVVVDDDDRKMVLTPETNAALAGSRKNLIDGIKNNWKDYRKEIAEQYSILKDVAFPGTFWEEKRLLRHPSASQFCIELRKKAEQWAIFWCDTPKATQQLYQKLLDDKVDYVAGLSGDGEEEEDEEDKEDSDLKRRKDKAFETKRAFLRLHKQLTEKPIEHLNHQPPRFRATVISNLGTFLNLYVKSRDWSLLPSGVRTGPLVQKYSRLLVMRNPEPTLSRSSNVKWRLHMPSAAEVISDTINLARLDPNLPAKLLHKDALLGGTTPLQVLESALVPYNRHLIIHPAILAVVAMPDAVTRERASPVLVHLDHYFAQQLQEIEDARKSTSSSSSSSSKMKKRSAPVPLLTLSKGPEEMGIVPFSEIPPDFDPFASMAEEEVKDQKKTTNRRQIPKKTKPNEPPAKKAKPHKDSKPSDPPAQSNVPEPNTPRRKTAPNLVLTNTKGHLQLVTKARFSADHVLCPKGVLLVF